jgi:hypothetical protein
MDAVSCARQLRLSVWELWRCKVLVVVYILLYCDCMSCAS